MVARMTTRTAIDTVQLAQRLEALALWYTPGAHAVHYPAGEADWLRIAAQRLLELSGDIAVMDSFHAAKGPHWKHWALLNTAGDIVQAASFGPRTLQEQVQAAIQAEVYGARSWVLRPVIFGRPA